MGLEAGQQLLHYRLIEKVGEGGMGVVWRATDTVLDREVAIKVLPDAFSEDTGRLARFEREAKLLASLNHPNIAAIHGLHQSSRLRFLAMEFVDGENLADRLARGPVRLDECLSIAVQIAEALEAAHDDGVIHRDLKPANVQVKPDGKVKVLDFGLARALGPDAEETSASATHSPTLTFRDTRAGTILGTAAYMSPEQARGRAADQRSDLWSFGVLLWEMLTGRRLFAGETVSDTLAAVLRADPEWDRLPANTPASLRRLLQRCLTRDPRNRLHHAADARLEIQAAPIGDEGPSVAAVAPPRRSILPWSVAAALFVMAVVLAGVLILRQPSALPPVMFSLEPPEGAVFDREEGPATVTADGSQIVVRVTTPGTMPRLVVRRFDELAYRTLPLDTAADNPFWSPDGRFIGFFAWPAHKLMRADIQGGPAVVLADTPLPRGGTWSERGVIVFSPAKDGPLYRIGAVGGEAEPVTTLDEGRGERGHVWPHFLPDGERFLYLVRDGRTGDSNTSPGDSTQPVEPMSLRVGSLDGEPARSIPGSFESMVWYAPPGFLLYLKDETLMARAFDLQRLAWRDEPTILAHGVDIRPEYVVPAFSVSRNGILTYHSATEVPDGNLVRRDREGALISEMVVSGSPRNLDLAPDGDRLAVERRDESRNLDIWIVDLDRGTHQRLTYGAAPEYGPVWSPDGLEVAYTREGISAYQVLVRASSGAGEEKLLYEFDHWVEVVDWSPDGEHLLFEADDGLWVVGAGGGEEPLAFLTTPFGENTPRFSPGGKWISYDSDESGRWEVYVRAWPPDGGSWQVSTDGGVAARWSADGKELYFATARSGGQLFAASVYFDSAGALRTEPPRQLFEGVGGDYEPLPGGKSFVLGERKDESLRSPATVVLNWTALLERR